MALKRVRYTEQRPQISGFCESSRTARQMAELNACWNSAFHKSFGIHRWESVRQFNHGLGRLDLINIFMLRKWKFMCKTYRGSNILMHNLLWCYMSSSGIDGVLCLFVFSDYYSVVKHIQCVTKK